MKKLQIEQLLLEIEYILAYHKTSYLKADIALRLLRYELDDCMDIEMTSDLKGMSEASNRITQNLEMTLSIIILEHYLDSNYFDFVADPEDKFNQSTVNHLVHLNRRLEKIVSPIPNTGAMRDRAIQVL